MKNSGHVEKSWGYEIIWATNEKYCGKLLCFNHPGSKTSMHFHKNKDETWFVNSGVFKLRFVDLATGNIKEGIIKEGDVVHNPPLQPHQLEALTSDAIIFEVSTEDDIEDIYRIPSMIITPPQE